MLRFAFAYIWNQIQTTIHKFHVGRFLIAYDKRLWKRALKHDLSKYRWDEAEGFAKTIFDLKKTEYGTPEYQALLDFLKPGLTLHYQRNTHHPQHYENGFAGMSDDDIIELVADWSAAVRRTKNGDLEHSIVTNAERFDYDEEQAQRLRNIARKMSTL